MKLVIFILAAALGGAEQFSRTIEKSFPLTGNSRAVVVCGTNGGIEVTGTDGNEVRFTVKEELEADSAERLEELKKTVEVAFRAEAGTVTAAMKGPWGGEDCGGKSRREDRRWDYKSTRVKQTMTVAAPRDARVELRMVNGSIHVTGMRGAYEVRTVNGGITMEGLEGAGEVRTVNGTVKAVYRKNPGAETQFRTVNGKLDLYFQPPLNADFSVKTVNGKAYTDFDMTAVGAPEETKGMKVIHRRGASGTLRAGSGGVKISTETVNGSILIHSLEKERR